uniref:Reverse transcriptase domain-containing protein n=1 Tax=Cannabis sativa TaxID=3483 RepID=A0A803PRU1_CANSA
MAKTRSKNLGKKPAATKTTKLVKKRGPTSSGDVKRTKSMEAVLGIEPIDFSDVEEDEEREAFPALSPRSSLSEIQRQEDVRLDFSHFMEANRQCNSNLGQGSIPPILRSGSVVRSLDSSFQSVGKPKVKITMDDIEEEVSYWNSTIVCYVLGANPPLEVLEGFARRIWKKKVDKVGLISYGIFLIRFTTSEDRDSVLNGGYTFFNKRPVIMKAWHPDLNFRKEDIRKVPILIQLENLDLKYWGQNTLFKLVGEIGEPILVDEVTKHRQKLTFPRVLVEVSMTQELVEKIEFEDEHGFIASVGVKYEWKPILCTHCKGLGHTAEACRKKFGNTATMGDENEKSRKILWTDLEGLNTQEAWVVLGDFNDILNQEERVGDRVKDQQSHLFKDCVNDCQLEDIRSSGKFFTWCNKQQGRDRIYSKIDRILANLKWFDLFPGAEAIFMNEGMFDHSPALLTFHQLSQMGKKPFRYFRMWSSHPDYAQQVNRVWKQVVHGTLMYQIVAKLKALKPVLKQINREGFSDLQAASIQAQEAQACQHRRRVIARVMENGPTISNQQRESLLQPITDEEIKKAMFDIPGAKAPGPDGYSSYFFQDNWNLVGEDICNAVRSFLHSGKILREINCTALTIIPKVRCLNNPGDYRPIACCNVIYKVATKVICSRLKHILPDIVAQNQGGFVQERFIAHNIMICQDLVRHYGRHSKKANCIIKLDLQKAYDTIEWDFLEEVLKGLLFPDQFISLIMNCIRTPKFSLFFNGSLHGFFESKRGLRQGDPLSPLLFVIGMEYLTRIMKKVGCKKDFAFHERCDGLKLFSVTSGLQPNKAKSAIYCSNMEEYEIGRVLEASGFTRQQTPFRYLGVPICTKKISKQECNVLIEKMIARIQTWSTKHISFAGRAVLINSVLSAIHSYWCQILKLPKKVIHEIEAICRAFLWKGQFMMQGAGLLAWDKVCQSRTEGGSGIKKIAEWNVAALFKYVWALANKEDNLWVKWIHNVYLKEEEWWEYQAPSNGSWYWKQMVAAKNQLSNLVDTQNFSQTRYTISLGYELLCPIQNRVTWSNEV